MFSVIFSNFFYFITFIWVFFYCFLISFYSFMHREGCLVKTFCSLHPGFQCLTFKRSLHDALIIYFITESRPTVAAAPLSAVLLRHFEVLPTQAQAAGGEKSLKLF